MDRASCGGGWRRAESRTRRLTLQPSRPSGRVARRAGGRGCGVHLPRGWFAPMDWAGRVVHGRGSGAAARSGAWGGRGVSHGRLSERADWGHERPGRVVLVNLYCSRRSGWLRGWGTRRAFPTGVPWLFRAGGGWRGGRLVAVVRWSGRGGAETMQGGARLFSMARSTVCGTIRVIEGTGVPFRMWEFWYRTWKECAELRRLPGCHLVEALGAR